MTHASTTSFPRHPRLRSFARRFGRAHLDFACHAAFPLALTPDLLYLLWAAFPRDARDQPIGAPWVAVADLLLSSLCDEVGHELFEFEPEVRDELLAELKRSPRFGPARITALAAFVSEYVGQQLRSSDPFVRDFAEAQHWAARAATDPASAAAELARAYAELRGTERDRLLRLEAIIEAIARPERASDIESLLPYARALADWVRGDQARAAVVLRSMVNSTGQIRLGGLVLPLPPAMAAPGPGSVSAPTVPGGSVQQGGGSEAVQSSSSAPLGDEVQNAEARARRETALRQLRALELQEAYQGPNTPAHIMIEIEDLQSEINRLNYQLHTTIEGDLRESEYFAHLQQIRAIKLRRLNILEGQQRDLHVQFPEWSKKQITLLHEEIIQIEQQLRDAGIAFDETASNTINIPLEGIIFDETQREVLIELYWQTEQRWKIRKEQEAIYGPMPPPEIIMEVEDLQKQLQVIEQQLGSVPLIEQKQTSIETKTDLTTDERAKLIEQYWQSKRSLRILEEQYAIFGLPNAPPEIIIGIENTREQIAAIERQLGGVPPEEQPKLLFEMPTPLSVEARLKLEQLRLSLEQRLLVCEEQRARRGPYTPPEIIIEIEDLRTQIALIDQQLNTSNDDKVISQSVEVPTTSVPTRPQLEQQRADIQRRLQKLEQRSHRTPEPTPQSETEAAELRHQLDEIERQIASLPAEEIAQLPVPDIEIRSDEASLTTISLHIARQGSGYSISLVGDAGIAQAALAPSEAQLEELAGLARRRLDEVVNTQVGGQFVYQSERTSIAPEIHAQSLRTLAEAGSVLYHQLFFGPGSGEDSHALGNLLRELSQRARLRITIISERVFLPWALLYDGPPSPSEAVNPENFWGFRHAIECQLPSTSANLPAIASGALIAPDTALELAFAGDNGLDSQLAQPVVEQQRASLSALPNVRLQDYSNVSDLYRLLSDSSMATDVIYTYAHLLGNSDADAGDARIRLGNQDISVQELRARLPATPLPGRPFVFMNTERVLSADPTQTDSFVPYFLQRGARAVLGGEASLPVFFAAQFGLEFVSRFVAGEESAGNLLLALRRAYLTQRRNVLGLLYALYGHADARVKRSAPGASNVAFDEEEFDPESFDFQDFGSEADNHPPIF